MSIKRRHPHVYLHLLPHLHMFNFSNKRVSGNMFGSNGTMPVIRNPFTAMEAYCLCRYACPKNSEVIHTGSSTIVTHKNTDGFAVVCFKANHVGAIQWLKFVGSMRQQRHYMDMMFSCKIDHINIPGVGIVSDQNNEHRRFPWLGLQY